jgi:OpgC protein, C terminal domain.
MIGVAMGRLSDEERARLLRHRRILLLLSIAGALAGLAISAVWRIPAAYALLPEPVALTIYTRIDKSSLHPVRLLHFLSMAYLVTRLGPAGRGVVAFRRPGQALSR